MDIAPAPRQPEERQTRQPIRFLGKHLRELSGSRELRVATSSSPRTNDPNYISPKASPREYSQKHVFAPLPTTLPGSEPLIYASWTSDNETKEMEAQLNYCASSSIKINSYKEIIILARLILQKPKDKPSFIPSLEIYHSINDVLQFISENQNCFSMGCLAIVSTNVSFKKLNIPDDLPVQKLFISTCVSEELSIGPQKNLQEFTSNTDIDTIHFADSPQLSHVSLKKKGIVTMSEHPKLENITFSSEDDISIVDLNIGNASIDIKTKGKVTLTREQHQLYEEGKITIEAQDIKIDTCDTSEESDTESSVYSDSDSHASQIILISTQDDLEALRIAIRKGDIQNLTLHDIQLSNEDLRTELNNLLASQFLYTGNDNEERGDTGYRNETENDQAIAVALHASDPQIDPQNPNVHDGHGNVTYNIKKQIINYNAKQTISLLKHFLYISTSVVFRLILAAVIFNYFPQIPFIVV